MIKANAVGAVALGVLAAAAVGFHAEPARACGGFFCSQSAPVEQTAEEIIFAENGNGTVTAVISIRYQGPAEKFAWVLPVAGVPDVSVSSNIVFDRLRASTAPSYSVNTMVEGTCKGGNSSFDPNEFLNEGRSQDAGSAVDDADGGIDVLASGQVGPFVYEVISVDPALDDAAQSAVDWLNDNGYDVTGIGPDVLRPYLADGLNLIAFKLQKGPNITSGSIRPVVITYEGQATIPIRPTAVAAADDMGVRVWVTGSAQAVPINYKSLVLNEALIDWFRNGSNYEAVVTAAADEAGGQGFVTEMGAPTTQLDGIVFPAWQEQQWLEYSRREFSDGFELIQQAQFQFRGWDGWREAVCGAVTLPQNVTCDMFGRDPNSYRGVAEIDQTLFLRTLYEGVVRPVMRAQDLLIARPYFTRLFSTMSAEDMTMDPAFDFNPDLADVSNQHVADAIVECNSAISYEDAPWRLLLPQGGVLRGKGRFPTWPLELDDGVPANFLVVQLGTKGSGKVVTDNGEMIRDVLADLAGQQTSDPTPSDAGRPDGGVVIGGGANPASRPRPDGGSADPDAGVGSGKGDGGDAGTGSSDEEEGGCSVAAAGGGAGKGGSPGLFVAVVLGLIARRRRHA